MAKKTLVEQLRGATALAIEATRGVTDVVEAMHHTIASGPAILGRPLERVSRALTAPTYGAVRGITGLVGSALDRALAALQPLVAQAGFERLAIVSALNGVLGDYLAATGNPLAIEMALCSHGQPLDLTRGALEQRFPAAPSGIILLVHGSSMNDEQWLRHGHDHGARLAAALGGFEPLYLRYNSGLHVSENGRQLATLLSALADAWPTSLTEIIVLGHSMGGLVARSALAIADAEHAGWRDIVTALVTLGTPHHGSPLERLGNLTDVLLTVSRYSAPLAKLGQVRSAGVTDLRYGNVLDADWEGRDRFEAGADVRTFVPLPNNVSCFAIAGTTSGTPTGSDGLVPVDSALGRHTERERALGFPDENQFVALQTTHLDLLSSQPVYEAVLEFLKRRRGAK